MDRCAMVGCSSPVDSPQSAVHRQLAEVVERHRRHVYRRPVSKHTRSGFDAFMDLFGNSPGPLVLDSGCGTGASTRTLAAMYPDHWVVGIDRSAHRLERGGCRGFLHENNLVLARADIRDFWRLAESADLRCSRHYLLYPNPWPKPRHLMRRWHGHPVFPALIGLGGALELRTNWSIFAEEFALALEIYGQEPEVSALEPDSAISPFERKYALSGHALLAVRCIIEGLVDE